MTMMEDRMQQIRDLTACLKQEGFRRIHYYMIRTRSRVTSVFPGPHIRQEETDDTMYSIEASYHGRACRMYTNHLEDTSEIIRILKETSEIYGPAEETDVCYKPREETEDPFCWDSQEQVSRTLKQDWHTAEHAPLIFLVQKCCYEQNSREIWMIDEQMNCIREQDGYHCFTIRAAAEKDGTRSSAADCIYGRNLQSMDMEHCVNRVTEEARRALGGEKLMSGTYAVILGGKVAAELLAAFLPAFYAENIQDGQSPLKGKQEEQIAPREICLRELPDSDQGRVRRSVDDEGVPVKEKLLIDQGVFTQPLYNRKTARKDGVTSTGNGFRSSIQSDVGTGVTNLILESREPSVSRADLEQAMGEGILVTRVDGVFAGADSTTGRFSLIAGGRVIRQGKEAETFREVTISGSFFECLRQIRKTGEELYTTEPGDSSVSAPDLWTGTLTISGK